MFIAPDIYAIFASRFNKQILGQADYVEPQCPPNSNNTPAGVQYPDYCFITSKQASRDGYGHGSHVTGMIINTLVETNTGVYMGSAPDANILSVRVLGKDGTGSYETVIKGIQYVIQNKAQFNVRVLNLSLSALADVPYFVDPLNRAVEQAWANGITVVAAAGNTGPYAETITVPGNDPYVITVGAVSANRTPGYTTDDTIPGWSAAGPTLDGFAKPDVVAPGSQIVSYMYNDPSSAVIQTLVKIHPDYSTHTSLFRMNGTSMAAAATSGVVALMLQAHPELTPAQVKFRLIYSARPALDANQQPVYNTLQQGMGRVWAPDAVLGAFPTDSAANADMNLTADLAHGYATLQDLDYHYQGPIQSMPSDDGKAVLYYIKDTDGSLIGLGVRRTDGTWMSSEALANARMGWAGARMSWAGGLTWSGNADTFASARMGWAGARMSWAGARMSWAGARMSWAGARMGWAGARMSWAGGMSWASARMSWAGSNSAWSTARMSWAGAVGNATADASSTIWVGDDWAPPTVPPVRPTPVAAQ
jgi:hypothetical protein